MKKMLVLCLRRIHSGRSQMRGELMRWSRDNHHGWPGGQVQQVAEHRQETDGGKLDHLWEMTEDFGGLRRLTAAALLESPSGLTAQAARDALKLAPSAGAAAAGSIDALLGTSSSNAAKLDAMLQLDGLLYQWTPNALERTPRGRY